MCLCISFNHVFIWCLFLGTIGHVAHGKSTLVKAISGVQVTVIVILEM